MATLQQNIEDAIASAVSERVKEVLKNETTIALKALEAALQKELGNIALGVLKHYRVETLGTEIVIRVQNDANFQRKV